MADDQSHIDKKQKTDPDYDWADSEEKKPAKKPKCPRLKVFNVICTTFGERSPFEIKVKVRSYSKKKEAETGMYAWMIEKMVNELAETEKIPKIFEESTDTNIKKIVSGIKNAIALSKKRGDWDDDIDDIIKKAFVDSKVDTADLFEDFFWREERMIIQESD